MRLRAKDKTASDQKRLDARRFWRSLPPSSTFKLSLAVFFTIAAIGFATDLFNPVGAPFYTVLIWAAYDGLGALAFLWVGKRHPRWIAAVIAAFIVTTIALNRAMPSYRGRLAVPADLQVRLILDGIFMLVTINVGYTLFVIFIQTEGFKHMRNQTELELAERLQTTLVPPLSLRTDRVSIEARSIASSKMGGDLADALESGGVVTCYVADVSGHGVAAGVLMGMVKIATRMALLRGEMLDEVLRSLDRVLPGVKDPSSYLTFAGLRFAEPGIAEYSTAGHPPILHFRRETNTTVRLAMEQFPVGLIAGAEYRAAKAECSPGDIFAMLTDGIIEVADPRDEEFGLDRVEQLLLENATKPLAEIAEIVISAATSHGRQTDDQTILLARIAG
ncbi:MAG TPA: PP2C family protein-serine/threonine phosphatase [Bryobacteraceae bacterium]|nr:PP2C family protein-serine/threonine phosphatase [Bryobacteraceae bacterium]